MLTTNWIFPILPIVYPCLWVSRNFVCLGYFYAPKLLILPWKLSIYYLAPCVFTAPNSWVKKAQSPVLSMETRRNYGPNIATPRRWGIQKSVTVGIARYWKSESVDNRNTTALWIIATPRRHALIFDTATLGVELGKADIGRGDQIKS